MRDKKHYKRLKQMEEDLKTQQAMIDNQQEAYDEGFVSGFRAACIELSNKLTELEGKPHQLVDSMPDPSNITRQPKNDMSNDIRGLETPKAPRPNKAKNATTNLEKGMSRRR